MGRGWDFARCRRTSASRSTSFRRGAAASRARFRAGSPLNTRSAETRTGVRWRCHGGGKVSPWMGRCVLKAMRTEGKNQATRIRIHVARDEDVHGAFGNRLLGGRRGSGPPVRPPRLELLLRARLVHLVRLHCVAELLGLAAAARCEMVRLSGLAPAADGALWLTPASGPWPVGPGWGRLSPVFRPGKAQLGRSKSLYLLQ